MSDIFQPVTARTATAIPGKRWLAAWLATLLAGPVVVMSIGFLALGPISFVAAFMAMFYAIPCSLALLALTLPVYWLTGQVGFFPCAVLGIGLPIVETAFVYDIAQRGVDPWTAFVFAFAVVLGLLSGLVFRHVLTHDDGGAGELDTAVAG